MKSLLNCGDYLLLFACTPDKGSDYFRQDNKFSLLILAYINIPLGYCIGLRNDNSSNLVFGCCKLNLSVLSLPDSYP